MNIDRLDKGISSGTLLAGTMLLGFTPSTYSSTGEAGVDALNGLLSGASSGASLGTAIMPGIGTAIGAGVGAVAGFLPKAFKKGRIEGGSFVDAGTLVRGGIFGHTPKSEYRRRQNAAEGNRLALVAGQDLLTDFAETADSDTNVLGIAYGGKAKGTPVYLSKGEVYVGKDGSAKIIKGKHKPNGKDDVLALADGGYVFSNSPKMKDENGKTPAENIINMINTKKIKNQDRFSLGTLDALKLIVGILKNKQEQLKQMKGLSNKPKALILTAATGDEVDDKVKEGWTSELGKETRPEYIDRGADKSKIYTQSLAADVANLRSGQVSPQTYLKMRSVNNQLGTNYSAEEFADLLSDNNPGRVTYLWPNYVDPNFGELKLNKPFTSSDLNTIKYRDIDGTQKTMDVSNAKYDPSKFNHTAVTTSPIKTVEGGGNGSKWYDVLGTIGSSVAALTPAIANMFVKPETVPLVRRPYDNTSLRIKSGLRNRLNYDPLLRAQAAQNYNASLFNPNTGSNLAFRLQNAVNLNNSVNEAYYNNQMANNQYRDNYANALVEAGGNYQSAVNLRNDLQARNDAAAGNIRMKGLSQLFDYFDKRNADNFKLQAMRPMLESAFTNEELTDLYNKYYR